MVSLLKRQMYVGLTALAGDKDGLVTLPVLFGPGRGMRLKLRLTSMSEGSMLVGRYEPAIARAFSQLVQPGWVVWDCGAFIGYYSLLFSRLVGPTGTVIAFEPDPTNYWRTEENRKLNGAENIQVVRLALGSSREDLAFVATHDQTSHLADTYVGNGQPTGNEVLDPSTIIRVKCLTPDDAYLQHAFALPNFIKFDLEGAETQALVNMRRIVEMARPILAVELHNPEADAAMWKFAETFGYRLKSLVTGAVANSAADASSLRICLATPVE